MTNEMDFESGVQPLLDLSEDELEAELSRRLAQTEEEVFNNQPLTAARAIGFVIDRQALQAPVNFDQNLAKRFLNKFNAQMYSLVCDDTNPDNAKLRDSLSQGVAAMSYAVSGVLVTTFGWLPGIATVIAVIIAKQAAQAGFLLFCEAWKERL